jgi:hypothetical protein
MMYRKGRSTRLQIFHGLPEKSYLALTALSIKLIDAEGRSCIYVPITLDGKVVDSEGDVIDLEDE